MLQKKGNLVRLEINIMKAIYTFCSVCNRQKKTFKILNLPIIDRSERKVECKLHWYPLFYINIKHMHNHNRIRWLKNCKNSYQLMILNYRSCNIVYSHRGCTSIYLLLSYPSDPNID